MNGVITGLAGFVVVESGLETVGFSTGVVVVGMVGFAVGTVVIGVVMSLWVLEISPLTFEPETETGHKNIAIRWDKNSNKKWKINTI